MSTAFRAAGVSGARRASASAPSRSSMNVWDYRACACDRHRHGGQRDEHSDRQRWLCLNKYCIIIETCIIYFNVIYIFLKISFGIRRGVKERNIGASKKQLSHSQAEGLQRVLLNYIIYRRNWWRSIAQRTGHYSVQIVRFQKIQKGRKQQYQGMNTKQQNRHTLEKCSRTETTNKSDHEWHHENTTLQLHTRIRHYILKACNIAAIHHPVETCVQLTLGRATLEELNETCFLTRCVVTIRPKIFNKLIRRDGALRRHTSHLEHTHAHAHDLYPAVTNILTYNLNSAHAIRAPLKTNTYSHTLAPRKCALSRNLQKSCAVGLDK